jgi:hypothetical protein
MIVALIMFGTAFVLKCDAQHCLFHMNQNVPLKTLHYILYNKKMNNLLSGDDILDECVKY